MYGSIGNQIKGLRLARHYTQKHMAGQLGISEQRYALIENGYSVIPLNILTKAATILGVTVQDITGSFSEIPENTLPAKAGGTSSQKIMDMLDLFYANKHMYHRLRS